MASSKPKMGRPPKMTPTTLHKLKEAFLMGCTDKEACLYSGISESLLYEYQKQHEDFLEEKEAWKHNPFLRARKTIYKNLNDLPTARWFLERRLKVEFGKDTPPVSDNEPRSIADLVEKLGYVDHGGNVP